MELGHPPTAAAWAVGAGTVGFCCHMGMLLPLLPSECPFPLLCPGLLLLLGLLYDVFTKPPLSDAPPLQPPPALPQLSVRPLPLLRADAGGPSVLTRLGALDFLGAVTVACTFPAAAAAA